MRKPNPTLLAVSLIACLLTVALPTAALAQGAGAARGQGPLAMIERTKQIMADMKLPPDQQARIDAILDQATQDAQQLRGQLQAMDMQERAEKVRDFLNGVKDKIQAVLTPEQKDQFEKKLEEARAAIGGQMRGAMLERLRGSLEALDLSEDQRAKIHGLLDDASKAMNDTGEQKSADDRQAKMRETMQNLREQLQQVLTPDQLQELRQKMQQNAGNGGGPRLGPAKRQDNRAQAPATQPIAASSSSAQPPMMNEPADTAKAPPGASANSQKPPQNETPAATLDVGQPAPDFKLPRLDGGRLTLSQFKGHVVALVFGSYTSPTFRDRAAGFDKISRDLQGKANIFLIYTKEVHPVGGWEVERNKLDNVLVEQPTTETARQAMARQARDMLRLTMPIAVDSMDDATATEYGAFPDGAFVINRDGTIAGKLQWAEETALRHIIDEALSNDNPAKK